MTPIIKILILLFTVGFLLSCEDEKNEDQFEINLTRLSVRPQKHDGTSPDHGEIHYPVTILEWRSEEEGLNNRLYERLWICHYSKYSILASHNLILQNISYDWESVDIEDQPRSQYLHWDFEYPFSEHLDDEYVPVGTTPYFELKEDYCGHISISGTSGPDSEADSLGRIRIHNVLDYYSENDYILYTVTIRGLYQESFTENLEFEYVHLDSFATIIDTTTGH